MPELPEVETISAGIRQTALNLPINQIALYFDKLIVFPKKNIIDVKETFSKLLINNQFIAIERLGKYIIITLHSGEKIIVHLRMTGQFFIVNTLNFKPDKHVHLQLFFNNNLGLIYRDIRKFGRWLIIDKGVNPFDLINAGPDALKITIDELKTKMLAHTNVKIKAFLLNQLILAGVGNIYADEICFELGVDPEHTVKGINAEKMLETIVRILNLAIVNKGTSLSDYVTANNTKGNFQNLLKVYHQKKCVKCNGIILRKKVAGRGTNYCPVCQTL